MSASSPDFPSALRDFYRALCNVSTVQTQLSNELFCELALVSPARTLAGVRATSHSEWILRFSRQVWDQVREVAGIRYCRFRSSGLTQKELDLIENVQPAVLQSLRQIELPADAILDNLAADVEGEFRRVLVLWRQKGRSEADGTGGKPVLLQIEDDIAALFQRTVDLLRFARGPRPQSATQFVKTKVILSLGESQYRIDNVDPIVVSDSEDSVLLAFLDQESMDSATLVKRAGFDRAPHVLRRLRIKYGARFAPAITTPGGKGRGGYHVAIRAGS
jgi:hypothetical protein